MAATTVSLINMKGGVGKTTLTFNLAWFAAWRGNLKVLVVDLDPQSNLSHYFMGAKSYLKDIITAKGKTVVDIFEQFSSPTSLHPSAGPVKPEAIIRKLHAWQDGSLLDLIPSRLELAWTLKNPTEKAHLLPKFLAKVSARYDLILIDCAPTESILTTASYLSSRYLVVPVKPEFLATIGLPLLARSLNEFKIGHEGNAIDIAGIVFSDSDPQHKKPEQNRSRAEVRTIATDNSWSIFDNESRHSDSYAKGARDKTAIFQTKYARDYVKDEFNLLGYEFLKKVGLTT